MKNSYPFQRKWVEEEKEEESPKVTKTYEGEIGPKEIEEEKEEEAEKEEEEEEMEIEQDEEEGKDGEEEEYVFSTM